jgi:hypothetical protein
MSDVINSAAASIKKHKLSIFLHSQDAYDQMLHPPLIFTSTSASPSLAALMAQ